MPGNIDKAALTRQWVHSHEEDTNTEMVFRPSTFSFPRSRGRISFTLKPDGSLNETGIGPTDRPEESSGTWLLESGDALAFYAKPGAKPKKVLKIISVDKDKLVVSKQ